MSKITTNKEKLLEIAKDIREVIAKKQEELELSFIEETHIYYMRDLSGVVRSDYPSVSTVIKQFYNEFPDLEKSFDMCNGDIIEQDKLLTQWRGTADYANGKGSRTHFLLETDLLKLYGSYKSVREPIFNCDSDQIRDSNAMIDAGHSFIQLMHRRGAVLLDTEMVLGSPELGYTGQPDKVWIMFNEQGELGLVITDWKGLPLDTPIFTDSGWKTMGTLTINDKVFDKDGNLVKIKHVSNIKNKKCLKLKFDNNEEIISDFEHRWLVYTEEDGIKNEMVMTTQEINDYGDISDLKVCLAKPLYYDDDIDLEINPYEFGVLLGSNKSFDNIETYNDYFKSSYKQRMEILRGYNTSKSSNIVNGVNKKNILTILFSSLGFNVQVSNIDDYYYELNYSFKDKTIKSIEEVESVPTKCIEVNSPSSTFLYGHTFSVTHNTNKQKNFEVHSYTEPMLPPFDDYMDTALSHYMIQLPLYARLLLDMLKDTKYADIKLFGAIIVHLTDNSKFFEYRIPKKFIDTVLTMNPLMRIDEVMANKKTYAKKEENRKKLLKEALSKQ